MNTARILALLPVVTSLGGVADAAGESPDPYTVTTTVGMITDIVRQVAGDKAAVQGMMKEGVDPQPAPKSSYLPFLGSA